MLYFDRKGGDKMTSLIYKYGRAFLLGLLTSFIIYTISRFIPISYSTVMMVYTFVFILISMSSFVYLHKMDAQEYKHFIANSYYFVVFSLPLYLVWFIFG